MTSALVVSCPKLLAKIKLVALDTPTIPLAIKFAEEVAPESFRLKVIFKLEMELTDTLFVLDILVGITLTRRPELFVIE